jgi:hypothetical protein
MDSSTSAQAAASSPIVDAPHAYEQKEADPAPQPMEIDGQGTCALCYYRVLLIKVAVYDALVCVLSVCAGEAVVCGGPDPRRDDHGKQLCEVCKRRLCRTKGKKYTHPPGLICQRCHNQEHPSRPRAATSKRPSSTVEPSTPKRVRRTLSDPGEPANLTRKRTRAQPPTTRPAVKKTRVHPPPVDPSLLLERAHTQRLALLASEQTAAAAAAPKRSTHPVAWRLVVWE